MAAMFEAMLMQWPRANWMKDDEVLYMVQGWLVHLLIENNPMLIDMINLAHGIKDKAKGQVKKKKGPHHENI